MNPPVVEISTERFTALWEIFQAEANKLASGVICSGIEMYSSIYRIVSGGDVSYAVRLHWCIGKFFFALAVKLREKMNAADWIESYATAFQQYEITVETINILAVHLNEAIQDNKECKSVKIQGYAIWERCILQYRHDRKLPSFSESLLTKKKYADVCLRSLSKIVTNSEDRFEYYKNNYEASLLSSVVAKFEKEIETTEKPLPSYLARCSTGIAKYMETYTPFFLPMSLPVLEDSLERVIFSKHADALKKEIEKILFRKDKAEIQALCIAVRELNMKIFPMFLEHVNDFCLRVWPKENSCAAAASAYWQLTELLLPNKCKKIQSVLDKILSVKITRPGIGKELSSHLESLIHKKDQQQIRLAKNLLDSVQIKEEKEIFYTMYISRLASRLISLHFDSSIEKQTSDLLDFPWIVKKKVRRIFEDMVESKKENDLFRKNYGFGQYLYKMAQDNEIFVYGIIATACVWPIPENAVQNINLPAEIQSVAKMFAAQYLAKNPRKKIAWVDTLSIVEIEVKTNQLYTIEMPLVHYAVVKAIETEPGLSIDKIAAYVGVSTKSAANVLESLLKIAIIECINSLYYFNSKFIHSQERIELKASEGSSLRTGNRKSYYQAWVVKKLKQAGEHTLGALSETMQQAHPNTFEWNILEYTEALKSLNERGIVEIVGSKIKYIP